MRPFGSPQQLQQRRERAIDLLEQGAAPVDVARRLNVDRRSVRRWKAAWLEKGGRGIEARPAPGRPPKLTPSQRRRLERLLLKGARSCGFATDLWTCSRVTRLSQGLAQNNPKGGLPWTICTTSGWTSTRKW